MISMILILLIILLIALFLRNSDSTFNLWFWSRFGVNEEAYFRNKVVWIVGCSSGIGEQIALRLAKYDCRLILSARRIDLLEDVKGRCDEISKSNSSIVYPIDIVEFDELKVKASEVIKLFGQVDIIILNTGQSQRANWITVDPQVDSACFNVNALGPTMLAREYLKCLKTDEKGVYPSTQFVVVSSIAGIIPATLSPSYTASKHALMGYFRLLALEYSSKGISISLVCPSLTFAPNNVLTAFSNEINKLNGEILTSPTPAHMSSMRAAELILKSAANKITESWLSKTSIVLLMGYANLLVPGITNRIIQWIGLDTIRRIRTGGKTS